VIVALLYPTAALWLYFILLAQPSHPPYARQSAWLACKALQFGFPLIWVIVVQNWRPRWRPLNKAGIAEGLAFGAVVFVLMVAGYYFWLGPRGHLAAAGQSIASKMAGFGVLGLPGYAALGLFYSLIHSFLEEYYWRWFVYGQLRCFMGWKSAVVVSSLGFMGHHVLALSTFFGWFSFSAVLFSIGVAIGGAFWAWLYERTGSLFGPWLSHLLVDAAIFAIGYLMVADHLAH